jgi:hypothetical protein
MPQIDLPFEMPFDLSITQYEGDRGSHKTRRAIDLAPIGLNYNSKADFVRYVHGYILLLDHMRFGWLRINAYHNCWHYHYESIQGVNWAGAEVFGYNSKTGRCEQIYGTPIRKIDLGAYGGTEELSEMLESLGNIYAKFSVSDLFGSDYWDTVKLVLKRGQLRPASVNYNEGMIGSERAESFLAAFSKEKTSSIVTHLLPGGYAAQAEFFEEAKGLLTAAAVIGGIFLAINLYDRTKKSIGDTPGLDRR